MAAASVCPVGLLWTTSHKPYNVCDGRHDAPTPAVEPRTAADGPGMGTDATGRPVEAPRRPQTAVARIQRKRTKGWRMPPDSVYVGRPSRWGNDAKVGDLIDAPFVWDLPSIDWATVRDNMVPVTPALAVDMFRATVLGWNHDYRLRWLEPLRGKSLACWCPLDQPCHADVLLELAVDHERMEIPA